MPITDFLSVGSLIVAVGTIIWGIRQTFVTNRLAQELHRLSMRLDQSIQRLERARDLINNICIAWEDAGNRIFVEEEYDTRDLAKALTITKASLVELKALAKVIGDKQFLSILQQLEPALPMKSPGTPDQMLEWLSRLENHFQGLHERVYELMKDATREQKH